VPLGWSYSENPAARFVLEAATRSMERKALGGLIIRLPGSKTPLVPVRGFCFFVDGIPPPLPVARPGTTVTRKSLPRDLAHIVNAALA